MKAVVWKKYGPPNSLHLEEVNKPVPRENEILVKIYAATVTAGDCELRRFQMPVLFWLPLRIYLGLRKPRNIILGQELAGEIEAVGEKVKNFKPGDRVFAATEFSFGAYAEYICLATKRPIYKMPANLSFEEAATIPTGGINALHFVQKSTIQPGDKVLINGAGGSIGTYALQLVKLSQAEVTCVDSREKLEILLNWGADYVIDYRNEDFTKNGLVYDVIIDIVGNASFFRCLKSLRKNGRYILGNPGIGDMILGAIASLFTSKKIVSELAKYSAEDFKYLLYLFVENDLKPVMDKSFPLEQMVEAHTYVENGHKKGNVAIHVNHN
jgi:NADPH:quinone reductase-like Zn-dependent oxidoreductase